MELTRPSIDPKYTIEHLDITEAMLSALQRAEIYTITQLCRHSTRQLINIQGLGPKKVQLLQEALSRFGQRLS